MKIKLLEDRVLVDPINNENKSAGGIFIPEIAREKPQKGVIISVGLGKKDEPMSVKCGDNVLFGKYSGTEIDIENKTYLLMRESDILAIV